MYRNWFARPLLVLIACSLAAAPAYAQERFSLFVPTPQWDVERMVNAADLREGDFVMDLGSGDGRIVLEAVRKFPGVRGRGIEINEKLVHESREKAKAEGISNRVDFLHQNAFDADLREATVIFLWLFPELMRLLRPKILREARPGTRIITRTWNLGSWTPDETFKNGSNEVYKYIVPAEVAGNWYWDLPLGGRTVRYSAVMEQQFQKAEGAVRVGKRRDLFENVKLTGDQLSFTLNIRIDGMGIVNHRFEGRVGRRVIEGKVSVRPDTEEKAVEMPWRAIRATRSRYFTRDTGTDLD
jgi:hypothetical protein